MNSRLNPAQIQTPDHILLTSANHQIGQLLLKVLEPHQLPLLLTLHPGISDKATRQQLINHYHTLNPANLTEYMYSHLIITDLLTLYFMTPAQQLKYVAHHQQLTKSLLSSIPQTHKVVLLIPLQNSASTKPNYLHPKLQKLWQSIISHPRVITVYTFQPYHHQLDCVAQTDQPFYQLLHAAQIRSKAKQPIDPTQSCYPLHLQDLTNALLKILFQPSKATQYLLAHDNPVSLATFAQYCGLKIKSKSAHRSPAIPNPKLLQQTYQQLDWHPQISLKTGLASLYRVQSKSATKSTDQSNPLTARFAQHYQNTSQRIGYIARRTYSIQILKVIAILAIIALIPSLIQIVLLSRAYISVYQSYRSLASGQYSQAYRQASYADQYLGDLHQPGHISNLTTKLPFYKSIHSQLKPSIYLAQRTARTIKHGSQTADSANLLITTILDPTQDSSRLPQLHAAVQYNLEKLNTELAYLQATIPNTIPKPIVKLIGTNRYQQQMAHLRSVRQQLQLIQQMTYIIPEFTGTQDFVRYAFLFQNNNELRPTGGFIGSLAIVEFHQGQLHTWKIYDVYQTDGQLQGYVAAPQPIQQYLGESGWYLRDANWSPDYPTTVKQVEWFITKELRTPVDGVIAIDLEALRGLIAPFGTFDIAGIDQPISADNFDQLFQTHIEHDQFAGSRRKADTITDLATQLKTQLANGQLESRGVAARHVLNSLNQKHILLNFKNESLQQIALSNNWAGQTSQVLGYSSDTITDHLAIIDANLGVNKANAYVDRSIDHQVDLTQPYAAASTVAITYVNHSTTESKLEGTYRNYLRTYIPADAELRNVTIQSSQTQTGAPNLTFSKTLTPEQVDLLQESGLQSIGFLVEVPKQHTSVVTISYYLPDTLRVGEGLNRYQLQIIKQPGTIADPYQLTITHDSSLKPQTVSDGFIPLDGVNLTGDTYLTYNTQLLTDQYLTVRFKQ